MAHRGEVAASQRELPAMPKPAFVPRDACLTVFRAALKYGYQCEIEAPHDGGDPYIVRVWNERISDLQEDELQP